jgi:hypothetical protein
MMNGMTDSGAIPGQLAIIGHAPMRADLVRWVEERPGLVPVLHSQIGAAVPPGMLATVREMSAARRYFGVVFVADTGEAWSGQVMVVELAEPPDGDCSALLAGDLAPHWSDYRPEWAPQEA